jgi:hypothetical protein
MTVTLLPDLLLLKSKLFDPLSLNFNNYFQELESSEYNACRFSLSEKSVRFRTAKITPKKVGQFVTLWKRATVGLTTPLSEDDDIDFVMIYVTSGIQRGLFMFPKTLLIEKKILSTNKIEGKRGFRIYPPWDLTENKQARQTQAWQVAYFLEIRVDQPIDQRLFIKLDLIKT